MPRKSNVFRPNSPDSTRISPAPYAIDLPYNVEQSIDSKCASYWVPGCDVALQISSYLPSEGRQLSARRRMAARLARGGRRRAQPVALGITHCDCFAVSILDNDGIEWIHAYLVWPDLALYATVSGSPKDIAGREGQWALEALRSVCPVQRPAPRLELQLMMGFGMMAAAATPTPHGERVTRDGETTEPDCTRVALPPTRDARK